MTLHTTETQQDVFLRKMSENHIRVAVVGNVDAGKSTFIGAQVSGALDDGRGAARSFVLKHAHELKTGRSSSVTSHLFGMDDNAKPIQGGLAKSGSRKDDEAAVARKATKLVTLIDLAGHEKYLKTTVTGIARGMADYAFILVNAMHPPNHMTMQHLKLCVSMGIPVIVILTKMDRCSEHTFSDTKKFIKRMLQDADVGLRPYEIRSMDDVHTVKHAVATMSWTPVIPASCVSGQGLEFVRQLLMELPQRRQHAKKQRSKSFEFLVEEVFQVTGVGTVLSGFVSRGEWHKGETLYVGPTKDGATSYITVPKSVHIAQTPVDHVWAGHSVCFAIPKLPRRNWRSIFSNNRKGIVAKKEPVVLSKTFKADIALVRGNNSSTTIAKGRSILSAHILHNKQSVRVVKMNAGDGTSLDFLRPGDRAIIQFEFAGSAAYVRPGMRVILRDGPVRGYGIVVKP